MDGRYQAYPECKDSGINWMGEIPAGWEVGSLRYAFSSISNGSTSTQIAEGEYTQKITRIETISDGEINFEKVGFVINAEPSYKLDFGDLLLSHINSLSMIGNVAQYLSETPLFHGMNLLRLSNSGRVHYRYCYWYLKSTRFRQDIESVAKRAINQASVPISSLKQLVFLFPPFDSSLSIANFLDHETAKIDTLIDKQQQLIKLLKEKRQAVISHAVTKGLNPAAPMKDSGVEWLGEVPEHWEVVRMRYLCNITTGGRDTQDAKEDGAYPFFVRSDTIERIDSYSFDGEGVMTSGDGAGVGKIFHHFVGKCEIHQRVYLFHQFRKIKGRLLYLFIKENLGRIVLAQSAKSTVDSLRLPMLQDFPICFGSEKEQGQICEYVEVFSHKIERLLEKAECSILLLQERRTALISAAVTGKIDVRNWKSEQAESRMEVIA
jgi:type I restriction enzyme S subunit